MIKARIVLIGSLLVTTAGAVAAQADDTARLKTVVVSASKVPQPASVLTQPVTVLSGEDLRARGVLRVTDALREAPSVALAPLVLAHRPLVPVELEPVKRLEDLLGVLGR